MIVKIIGTKPDPGGLVRYLFGRGTGQDLNLHENQRSVAGTTLSAHLPGRGQVEQIAEDLRAHQRVWGTAPKAGHVQHIVISLNPGDRPVTDAEWRTITEDYLTAQGITVPDKAAVRWVAVNHGRNAAGADHVHIALSLVRADGTKVNTWQDGPRSQRWATQAEQRYGLVPLDSRSANAAARGLTRGELAKARATGREPISRCLADIVRPIAAASSSEVDYVQRLRAAGLDPRPRVTDGRVTGYSVAAEGQRFGGGTLAPELRLPALRRVQWDDGNGLAAAREWQHPTPHRATPTTAEAVRYAVLELERELWRAPVMTRDEHGLGPLTPPV
ncbi:relaxase/mobilization nuclease domain-containing protein [Nakamurella sp. GG22]